MRLALALILLAVLAPTAAADDLTVTRTDQLSPRLREYGFTTAALDGETNVRVLLPAGYDDHPDVRYPVLYLLHGCCDADVTGSRAWTTHGMAEEATAPYPLIVVMPDGGRGGFYTDWYRNGLGGTPMWETYHLGQLVPWVDANLRTRADRSGRVVAGLSMGGFGAMKYAAEHPDRFVAAASFSGAVDTNLIAAEVDALGGLDGGKPGDVFGLRQTEEIRWRGQNPWDLAENLRGLQLTLRTGNGQPGPYDDPNSGTDPLESSVHDQTLNLHAKLGMLGIPHVFEDYGPGHHAWPYWARDLVKTLPDLMATLDNPPPPPAAVTYTAAAPEYDIYGWHVKVDRPALEFSRLAGAGRRGFTLAGSGTGTVTTPPGYEHAEVSVAGGPPTVMAGPRLTITVPLGPGNPDQEYRPNATTTVTETPVAITPCTTRTSVVLHVRRHARVRAGGRRVAVRRRHAQVALTPGAVTRVVIRGGGRAARVRHFRRCA